MLPRKLEVPAPQLDGPALLGADERVLHRLHDTEVSLAVWQRSLAPALTDWLDRLCLPMPRQGRWRLAPTDPLAATVQAWLHAWLDGIDQAPPAWCDDIASVLTRARTEFPEQPLAVRLDVVANDGCRLFHVDRLVARWICTYRGPGTEWLPDTAVDRSCMECGNNHHVLDWGAVRRLERGWVAALKGKLWSQQGHAGLVHRSPPASPAQPRILLVVNPVPGGAPTPGPRQLL